MSSKIVNPATIAQNTYNDSARVQKNTEAGLSWKPLGTISPNAKRIGKNMPVMIYNPGGNDHFVKFGAQNITAPTSGSDGLPVLSKSTTIYNSGENEWIKGDDVGLLIYIAE